MATRLHGVLRGAEEGEVKPRNQSGKIFRIFRVLWPSPSLEREEKTENMEEIQYNLQQEQQLQEGKRRSLALRAQSSSSFRLRFGA